jgi:hypothetical protein
VADGHSGELSSYYILGYYTINTNTDGGFRNIRITVERPGLRVMGRTGSYTDKCSSGCSAVLLKAALHSAEVTQAASPT